MKRMRKMTMTKKKKTPHFNEKKLLKIWKREKLPIMIGWFEYLDAHPTTVQGLPASFVIAAAYLSAKSQLEEELNLMKPLIERWS